MLYRWFNLPETTRQWLKYAFVLLLAIGLVLALMPADYIETGIEYGDKIMHVLAFFGFAVLLDACTRLDFWRFQVPLLLVYGALVEVLQSFTSYRTFSLLDFVADAAGVLLYWLIFRMLIKPRIKVPAAA